jgi:uncharacterized membrane protein
MHRRRRRGPPCSPAFSSPPPALRLIGLNSGLWFDEIVTLVESARLPLHRIVTEFTGVNSHPFFSVLAHVSIGLFGESNWALRLPACLFGVASVWMVYVLGSRAIGRTEALAGAAVMATSYHHIWFSQNARGYTMIGFFALVSTYAALRAHESGRPRDFVLFVLASVAGIYTHLTMAFVLAGQALAIACVAWLEPGGPRPRWKPWIWTCAATGVLAALAYAPFMSGLFGHLEAEAPRQAAKVATGGWAIAEAVRSLLSGAGVPAAIVGGMIAVVGALSLVRRAPFVVALLLLPAVVTAVAILGLGQPLRPRFFFFLAGVAAIFVGHGIGVIAGAFAARGSAAVRPSPAVVAGLTVLVIALSAIALPRNYRVPKQDFDGAVAFLDAEAMAGAQVAAAGPACFPIEKYFGRNTWPCLKTVADLPAGGLTQRRLVAYTLPDYIDNAGVRALVLDRCSPVRTFPGTLGGGDIVICRADSQ